MPDRIHVELPEFVRQIAREAAREVIHEHIEACSIRETQQRVNKLESRLAFAAGAILGSGLLGGGVAAVLTRLLY